MEPTGRTTRPASDPAGREAVARASSETATASGGDASTAPPDLLATLAAAIDPRATGDETARIAAHVVGTALGAALTIARVRGSGRETEAVQGGDGPDRDAWRSALCDVLTEAEFQGSAIARPFKRTTGGGRRILYAAPVPSGDDGGTVGAIGVALDEPDLDAETASARVVAQLAEVRTAASGFALALRQRVAQAASGIDAEFASLIRRAAEATTLSSFAFAVCNALRNGIGAERVGLGLVQRGCVELLCISGQDDIPKRGPSARLMIQAMEECSDAGRPIVFAARADARGAAADRPGEATADAFLINARWRARGGGGGVATIPLRIGAEIVAVLALRMPAGVPLFHEDLRAVERMTAPVASMLPLVSRATESSFARGWRHVHEHVETFRRPLRLAVLLGGLTLVSWGLFGSLPWSMRVPAVVAADGAVEVTASMPGRLVDLRVEAGRVVAVGEVLARLDTDADEVALAEVVAEQAVVELEHRSAIRDGRPDEAARAEAEAELLGARRAVLEDRIERAVLRAPVAGTVLEVAEREQVGAVLALGDRIARIAPDGARRLDLLVPEHAIGWIAEGERMRFTPNAASGVSYEGRVELVAPAAQVRRDESVFVCRGSLLDPATEPATDQATDPANATPTSLPATARVDGAPTLRPGMEGVAHVDAGRRAPWWILFHRFIDPIRVRL